MSSSTFSHLPEQGQYLPRAPAFVSRTPLRRIGRPSSKRHLVGRRTAFWADLKQMDIFRMEIPTKIYVEKLYVFGNWPKCLSKFRLIVDEFSEMPDMLRDTMICSVYINMHGCWVKNDVCCIHHYVLRPRQHLGCALFCCTCLCWQGQSLRSASCTQPMLLRLDSYSLQSFSWIFQDFCFRWLMNRIKVKFKWFSIDLRKYLFSYLKSY